MGDGSSDGPNIIIDLDFFLNNKVARQLISQPTERLESDLSLLQNRKQRLLEGIFGMRLEEEDEISRTQFFIEAALTHKPQFEEQLATQGKERG